MGIYGHDQRQFFDQIKLLPRGQFFALGPAISDERILVTVGVVGTTHPEAGSAKHGGVPWLHLKRLEARCMNRTHGEQKEIVLCHCTCGIYAMDTRDCGWSQDPDSVLIEVYGWGRYVRGENGWRAQYAYPRAIHLRRDQEHLAVVLRKYRVPIFLEREYQDYDPARDGYEYGTNEANWNVGASEGADPATGADTDS